MDPTDTYLEGYQLGDPSIIEIMVKNACAAVEDRSMGW